MRIVAIVVQATMLGIYAFGSVVMMLVAFGLFQIGDVAAGVLFVAFSLAMVSGGWMWAGERWRRR